MVERALVDRSVPPGVVVSGVGDDGLDGYLVVCDQAFEAGLAQRVAAEEGDRYHVSVLAIVGFCYGGLWRQATPRSAILINIGAGRSFRAYRSQRPRITLAVVGSYTFEGHTPRPEL
ncbi:hypothetical protein BV210_19445 (plasmid) [Halorientalis sp. IM1011]|nr:hypothetical protein BV210_19445 [Halorientalis sp. IM1011]